ncbi:unnamed protein product, partial [Owenia fusiformis]
IGPSSTLFRTTFGSLLSITPGFSTLGADSFALFSGSFSFVLSDLLGKGFSGTFGFVEHTFFFSGCFADNLFSETLPTLGRVFSGIELFFSELFFSGLSEPFFSELFPIKFLSGVFLDVDLLESSLFFSSLPE